MNIQTDLLLTVKLLGGRNEKLEVTTGLYCLSEHRQPCFSFLVFKYFRYQ